MFSADYTEAVLGRSHSSQNGGVQELGLIWFTKVSGICHIKLSDCRGTTTDLHCDQKTHWTALSSLSYVFQWSEVSPNHRRSVLSDIHAILHIIQQKKGCFKICRPVAFQAEGKLWPVEYSLTVLAATTYSLVPRPYCYSALTELTFIILCMHASHILLVFVNYSVTGLTAPALGDSVSENMAAMKFRA